MKIVFLLVNHRDKCDLFSLAVTSFVTVYAEIGNLLKKLIFNSLRADGLYISHLRGW